jgi:predicted O-methyltransferase YrrM
LHLRLRGHGKCLHIFTHLTKKEKLRLYSIAYHLKTNPTIVEIGSYLGASSALLAAAAEQRKGVVYCVDTWQNDAMSEGQRDTYQEFLKNTAPYVDYIHPLRGRSLEFAEEFVLPIDLLFIDADHSYEGCLADTKAWLSKVSRGGIVIFHDYKYFQGVRQVVDEIVQPLVSNQGKVVENMYWAYIS